MAHSEWILEEAIRANPGHCADYYTGMCRFSIPFVRKFIENKLLSGELLPTTDPHRNICDVAVKFK